MVKRLAATLCLLTLSTGVHSAAPTVLPETRPLAPSENRAVEMVAGISVFLDRKTEDSSSTRKRHWTRNFRSAESYGASLQPNREHLRAIIGATDQRKPIEALEFLSTTSCPANIASLPSHHVSRIRWKVFEGVFGEGLLLEPHTKPIANIVVIPDAEQTPEQICGLLAGAKPEESFALHFAANGCRVVIPALLSRSETYSGSALANKWTNLTHREWIWRMAFELGRTTLGYEVQKIQSLLDWFSSQNKESPVLSGVAGLGEGGLTAFYAAALDERISAALVSGYFGPREDLWKEPGDRNLFGLLREFGDAEIATMIAPRRLLIEHRPPQESQPAGDTLSKAGRLQCSGPGKIPRPSFSQVSEEAHRAQLLLENNFPNSIHLLPPEKEQEGQAISANAAHELLAALSPSHRIAPVNTTAHPTPTGNLNFSDFNQERQARQVWELESFTQQLLQTCERTRTTLYWERIKSNNARDWLTESAALKHTFWHDVLGKCEHPAVTPDPRSRLVEENEHFTSYEVMLSVAPNVFASGRLQIPKGMPAGEKRPVVVCQHGLEGTPESCLTKDPKDPAFKSYKGFAASLAERGFITFAPQNPYAGKDAFRVLQRKANPLGISLFSIILEQHEVILNWLRTQPFVDPSRIAFYGLSYGGKSAMRLPSLLEGYCLSICSGDFNEWVRKNASVDYKGSYMFTGEYEMPEWNLGNTFNYAEMATLIAPRPFMVERGHHDGVGTDEWVSYEYAKVRRFYAQLKIQELTEIEYFDGPHTINGKGAFEFLHKHLRHFQAKP